MKLRFVVVVVVAAAAAALTLSLSACAQQSSVYGAWGTPDAAGTPGLQLSEDGKLSGTDGCNRLVGSFEVDGNAVTFGAIASTMMFCEGVDTWLGQAVTGVVTGDELTLHDQDGAEIGTLDRSTK